MQPCRSVCLTMMWFFPHLMWTFSCHWLNPLCLSFRVPTARWKGTRFSLSSYLLQPMPKPWRLSSLRQEPITKSRHICLILLEDCLQDQSSLSKVCLPLCLVIDIELCAAILSAWVGWPNRNLPVNKLQVAYAGHVAQRFCKARCRDDKSSSPPLPRLESPGSCLTARLGTARPKYLWWDVLDCWLHWWLVM